MTSHPNVRKHTPREASSRALVFAPDAAVLAWVEGELGDSDITLQFARSVREIIAALVEDPPPRAQILIADLDAMSAADVLALHAIRDTWYGSIIALGKLAPELRKSLNVELVLARPLGPAVLRKAVAEIGLERATTKMKTIDPSRR